MRDDRPQITAETFRNMEDMSFFTHARKNEKNATKEDLRRTENYCVGPALFEEGSAILIFKALIGPAAGV